MSSNRIDGKIVLRTTRERVSQSISDSARFGAWFGVQLASPFIQWSESARSNHADQRGPRGHEASRALYWHTMAGSRRTHRTHDTRFSFRWHPFAIEPDQGSSMEATTPVSFELRETVTAPCLRSPNPVSTNFKAPTYSRECGAGAEQTRPVRPFLLCRSAATCIDPRISRTRLGPIGCTIAASAILRGGRYPTSCRIIVWYRHIQFAARVSLRQDRRKQNLNQSCIRASCAIGR
jgi:hypothetical protein